MAVRMLVHDSVHGSPAAGVPVQVRRMRPDGESTEAEGTTRESGEWEFTPDDASPGGAYRLVLDTAGYFAVLGLRSTCREVSVGFQLPPRGAAASSLIAYLTPHSITTYVFSADTSQG